MNNFNMDQFIGRMPWMNQPQVPGKPGSAPQYNGGQVAPAPRGRVEFPGMFGGGLLGTLPQAPQFNSFNPFGNRSAGIFDQYMNQSMQRYGGPGGFFGFMPQQMKPTNSQPVPTGGNLGDGRLTWRDILTDMYNRTGGPTGGGN